MGFSFKESDIKDAPTLKDVNELCDHYSLFRYYVGDFKLGKPILSPFDSEKNPSFAVFEKNGKYYYKDFRYSAGDIVQLVRELFNLSYQEAINKIIVDSGLGNKFNTGSVSVARKPFRHFQPEKVSEVHIAVKRRKWQPYDFEFWDAYGVTPKTLKKYRVAPIKHYFVNGNAFKADKLAYVFKELKDNKPSLTIYQPRNEKFKWMKSHDHSVFYGWEQLPETGNVLILTKSLKDVMTIDSISGIPSTALQSEKAKPKPHVMEELKRRFKTIYVLYDNDYNKETNYGRVFGNKLAKEFNLKQLEIYTGIASVFGIKDISDMAMKMSKRSAMLFLSPKGLKENEVDYDERTLNRNKYPAIRTHDEEPH